MRPIGHIACERVHTSEINDANLNLIAVVHSIGAGSACCVGKPTFRRRALATALRRNRSFASKDGQVAAYSTMSAAFSPIMIDGALVLPDVSVGMIEASAMRRPAMPWTRS